MAPGRAIWVTRMGNRNKRIAEPAGDTVWAGATRPVRGGRSGASVMDTDMKAEPGRNSACFCGSGLRFKQCCGSLTDDRPPPHGIHVIEDFLGVEECRRLSGYADTRGGEPLMVVDTAATTANKVVRRLDPARVTERVDLGPEQATLEALVRRTLMEVIEPALGAGIEWFESPQLLRYRAGGFYKGHADSDRFDATTSTWAKVLDRDVSLLLYLNDGYTGGALSFPRFRYVLHPRPGMLVFFPSDRRYYHAAEPVLSGIRYAVVSWAAFQGGPKIHREPAPEALFMRGQAFG